MIVVVKIFAVGPVEAVVKMVKIFFAVGVAAFELGKTRLLDGDHRHVKSQVLARKRVVPVYDYGVFLDFLDRVNPVGFVVIV